LEDENPDELRQCARELESVTPEEKENIIAHVAVTEESLNDFMRRAFVETIERDNAKSKDNSK
jgi:hypothetical protein